MTEKIVQWVGIDVSKRHLDVYVKPMGLVLKVTNNLSGIVDLTKELQSIQPDLIVLEATGGMELDVAEHLSNKGFAVSIINPRLAHSLASDADAGSLVKLETLGKQQVDSLKPMRLMHKC